MTQIVEDDFVVPLNLSGCRLDHVMAELMPDYSRSRLQQWIKDGNILVNKKTLRSKDKVRDMTQYF